MKGENMELKMELEQLFTGFSTGLENLVDIKGVSND